MLAELLTLPRITATITIADTGEKKTIEFVNVYEMVENLVVNMALAEDVFGRTLLPPDAPECSVDNPNLKLTYRWADDNSTYCVIDAVRHDI